MLNEIKIVIGAVLLLFSAFSEAAIDAYPFPNEELQGRYQALIDELRCPQCLNTNLAGSDAMIAQDLRREVHRMLIEGKTDEEILEFMYQRYGDFILYRPRLAASTMLLWFGPIVLLVIAVLVLIVFLKKQRRDEMELTAEQKSRLDSLLSEEKS